jgi:pSer/pThr/pTyr-binding forkhead associated (FHA) protein
VAERAVDGATRALGMLIVERSPGHAPRVGERFSLRGSTSIGRDAGNDIPLSDEAASARHAVLELRDGAWWIEDLGSTNGTLLNGRRIERAERLSLGDELAIGRIAMRLEKGAG